MARANRLSCKLVAVTKARLSHYELFVIGKDDVVWRSTREGEDATWAKWKAAHLAAGEALSGGQAEFAARHAPI